jgi:undecaprenyl-diphosphatase
LNRALRIVRRTRAAVRQEFALLAVVALVAAALWAFLAIADEVLEGETHAADEAILLALRTAGDPADPIGPPWLEEMGRDATALGGVAVLTFITVAAVVYLLLAGKRRAGLFVAVSVTSGILLSSALKAGFDRPRPDLVPHGSIVHTASFPSGHSMMAALVYLTLGALLARLQPRRRLKVYLLSLAVLVTLAVGVSRVYLGVHWPTDVLAGWSAGAGWAMLSWLAAVLLQRRRSIESAEGDGPP